jgi:hypothetical protein
VGWASCDDTRGLFAPSLGKYIMLVALAFSKVAADKIILAHDHPSSGYLSLYF